MDNHPFGAAALREKANVIIARLRVLRWVFLNCTYFAWPWTETDSDPALSLNMLDSLPYGNFTFSHQAQIIGSSAKLMIECIEDFIAGAPRGTLAGPPRPTILSRNENRDEEHAPSSATTPTTFPQFAKLPHELKLMILEAACIPIACPLYLHRLVSDSQSLVYRELAASSLMPDRGLWNASALTRKVIKRVYEENLESQPEYLLEIPVDRYMDDMDIHYARAFTVSVIGRHIQNCIRGLREQFPGMYDLRIPMRPWEFDHMFTLDNELFRFDQLGHCWVRGNHTPFSFGDIQLPAGIPQPLPLLSPPQPSVSQPENTPSSGQDTAISSFQSPPDVLETPTSDDGSLSGDMNGLSLS